MHDPLNIVILTPWFPNQPNGWPARFISDSARAMAQKGHHVRVGVLRGFIPMGQNRWAGVEHHGEIDVDAFEELQELRVSRYLAIPKGYLRWWTNRSLDAAVSRMLRSFAEITRPDVVLVHTEGLAPGAVQCAHRLKLPAAVILHGENTNTHYLNSGGQAERFRTALGGADRLVVVGEPLRAYAGQLAEREDHIEVIWNGVEPPKQRRIVPPIDKAPLQLISVANLQEGKGIHILLEALEKLNQEGFRAWQLRIIGQGPQEEALRLQTLASGLNDQVKFLGSVSNSEVFEQLAECDVFVLPSYREAFGVAYLEAMSTGLLAIGVQGQGPAQFIVHRQTGLLVPPQSVTELANELRQLLGNNRNDWRDIATKGMNFASQNVTWEAHAVQMIRLMQRLVASDPPPPEFHDAI